MKKGWTPIPDDAPRFIRVKARDWRATAASGSGRVERKSGRRGLVRRWKVKGRTLNRAARSIQATYWSAWDGPVRGNSRQFATRLGRKAMANIQRNPRKGFCVPTNQTPRIGPVHMPMKWKKKPRTKRPAMAHAAICDRRRVEALADVISFLFR